MKVVALVSDLMFKSKIREALGGSVAFAKSESELAALEGPIDRFVVDLEARNFDPIELASKARGRFPGVPVAGFFSHVNVDLAEKAQAAGFDEVMPRSQFVKRLAQGF